MSAAAHSSIPEPFSDAFQIDMQALKAGVPVETMMRFLKESGLELKHMYPVVIPARTLKHRRSRAQPLSLEESDRLARVIRIYDQALRVFGDADKARRWLTRPKYRFEEHSPLEMLQTDVGGRMVEQSLGQIDHGIFA